MWARKTRNNVNGNNEKTFLKALQSLPIISIKTLITHKNTASTNDLNQVIY